MSGPQEMRRVRRTAAPNLDIRATTTKPKFTQPTNVIALTKTFSPPTSCFENILSMLPPASFIWNNEPVPVANNTVAACYPSEFLESYTSVEVTNSVGSTIGSSIVPAMSPFVCPDNYCTMFAEARNYIACCPSNYLFHPPDTTVDKDRPGYGGTCYSDLPANTNVPVEKWDAEGNIASGAFSQSTSGAQAFAHPIDGWALTSPTMIGCPTTSASSSSSNTQVRNSADQSSDSSSSDASQQSGLANSPTPSTASSSSSDPSTGAIVGATIGGCAALAALIALVWFLLARRRRNKNAIPKGAHQVADDFGGPKTYYRSEAPAEYPAEHAAHGGVVYAHEKAMYGQPAQLNDSHGVFEMHANNAMELSADSQVKTGSDAKIMNFYQR
ncbi:hypothetical protein BU23DRAFT_524916 [Bimuria novae-zelandiae CBS 107.79]|uniref:Mid2 domain-containing protein n=1 Tax=Bimuria novae-zelandiae CBS 107.79 TaxID=1447943 RepID=A0A6A5VRM5_9PLEO|nr:hypothetical protein BU23DRAFT_524916 [Bimuria novae-zelandiae CBS 107.79]